MTRKFIGLLAFVATGIGLMVSTITEDMNFLNIVFLVMVGCFFIISLIEHFNELKN